MVDLLFSRRRSPDLRISQGVRIEGQRAAQSGHGFIEPAQVLECHSESVEGRGIVGRSRFERLRRVVQAAEMSERFRITSSRRRKERIPAQRLLEKGIDSLSWFVFV